MVVKLCCPGALRKYLSQVKDQSCSACCVKLISVQLALLLEKKRLPFSGLLLEALLSACFQMSFSERCRFRTLLGKRGTCVHHRTWQKTVD